MAKLYGSNGIDSAICSSMSELCAKLDDGAGLIIISEEALTEESDVLVACVGSQPVWSDLPIIVLSRAGRESIALGDLMRRLGNVSIVERPMRMTTLLSLTRSGLRARARQYEVRQHFAQLEQAQAAIRESVEAERAARAEAERAGRTKDEFLATLSHELRTPLNAILGWTQVMRGLRGLSEDALHAVTVIERNARAQAQIIEDLLDMSSIISGKVRLDVQRVDLAPVIDATVETIKPAAEAKRIRLESTMEPVRALVRGDPHRLQQVLWNLLTNAVKFTRNGGRISITLARVGSHVQIEITDDGEGIDPGFLPHVFDRFRQADPSSSRRHGGLGLGLSIVKQLVELHGGTIVATSEGRDRGATFRVTLPLMAANDDSRQPASRKNPRRSATQTQALEDLRAIDLGGCRVLVVDDEPDARSLLQRLLQDCNATVTAATSAAEAIRALEQGAQDVLISDIGMPGEDGYVLIQRIRASRAAYGAIPAVALTAYARAEDGTRAVEAGFQIHLSKPVEPITLIATVQHLARRSAHAQRAPAPAG